MQTCSGASPFSSPVGDSKCEGDEVFGCKLGILGSGFGFELVWDTGQLELPLSVIGTVSCFGQGPPLCA